MNRTHSHYSPSQIAQLTTKINTNLEKVNKEIDECDQQISNPQELGDDVDNASMAQEKKSLLERKALLLKVRLGLEINLNRIAVGTIGNCEVTGEHIPFERMMCVPHTSKGVKGKGIDNTKNLGRKVATVKNMSLHHLAAVQNQGLEEPELVGADTDFTRRNEIED